MIEGLKVSDKWAPISGSPVVNVSRVKSLRTNCVGMFLPFLLHFAESPVCFGFFAFRDTFGLQKATAAEHFLSRFFGHDSCVSTFL